MFKFLKEKLSGAIDSFTKKAEDSSDSSSEDILVKVDDKTINEKKPEKTVKKGKVKTKEPKTEKKERKKFEESDTKEKNVDETKKDSGKISDSSPNKDIKKDGRDDNSKKGFFSKVFGKKEDSSELVDADNGKTNSDGVKVVDEGDDNSKKGFFSKAKSLIKISISEDKFNDLFWDIELALLENNVAVEVIEKFKSDLREELLGKKLSAFNLSKTISSSFSDTINNLFTGKDFDLFRGIKSKKPYVIMFVGVNGSGKTTNLSKVANFLKNSGFSVVLAACDTFRAAAIQQLSLHAENLGLKVVKQDYGSDAAAVAFDAISHAKSKGVDVVLIDTAGRSNANANLMDELKKVNKVANPDLTIFVGDSLTGNDVVDQANSFDSAVGIGGIILSKTDVDEKGGAAISISYVTGKPILFIGSGQDYADLKEFDPKMIIDSLGLSD